MPPLDIVATAILRAPELHDAARDLFTAYDAFLGILDDDDKRKHLDDLEPSDSSEDVLYDAARSISHRFQKGLDGVFLEDHDRLAELTKIYGVF